MPTNLSVLALVLALGAASVSAYLLASDRQGPPADDGRLAALEARLDRFESALEDLRGRDLDAPTLTGIPAETARTRRATTSGAPGEAPPSDAVVVGLPKSPEAEAALTELIDAAVDKKAERILRMQENKKPSLDEFVETLELTESQRREAERDVAQAQQAIKDLLEMPTADGSVLMDDLVEVMAKGMANPGKAGAGWAKFIGRVMSEKIPGENETYAVRIEAVKQGLRGEFEREWNEKQYRAFESWRMDPTEIRDVPGSPYKEIEKRVFERAKDLGVEIPEDK